MKELTSGDFTEALDPVALFKQWFEEARASEPNDPEAMTLATVDADGFAAENLTIENTWESEHTRTEEGSQAVALLMSSDRAVIDHVRLLGAQDTLYAQAATQGLIELANPTDGHAFNEGDGNALTYIGQQYAEFVAARGVIVDDEHIRGDAKPAAPPEVKSGAGAKPVAAAPKSKPGAPISSKKGR